MSDVETAPRVRKQKAALSPRHFEDLTLDCQTSLSNLSLRYAELHEQSNTRQVIGESERVSGGGTADTTGGIVASNERSLSDLSGTCELVGFAWNSIQAAHGKLTAIERASDQRAERQEQAQPAERLREAPATRGALVQVLMRNKSSRIADHRAEMEKIDARIRPLYQHIDIDDAEDVIRVIETRINQIHADSEKETTRLQRESTRLRKAIDKAKEKERAKSAPKKQSQWQKGA